MEVVRVLFGTAVLITYAVWIGGPSIAGTELRTEIAYSVIAFAVALTFDKLVLSRIIKDRDVEELKSLIAKQTYQIEALREELERMSRLNRF